ncbi:LOW QUALITY PROTEIN: hypothetical protein HID58_050752 [Brassica napus]|uniref:Uncharacterized protein n=1 Tax=Brassica napus TaxID=3708 RepID=A0ABQ8A7W4_BRANA|nr:LOW QUALITY PROTEIN: hypothetical protein HID58_050752 [Brassica napus]
MPLWLASVCAKQEQLLGETDFRFCVLFHTVAFDGEEKARVDQVPFTSYFRKPASKDRLL